MKVLIQDAKHFFAECREQDFGFYMVAAYLIFSYLRPQSIYPALDILPWTELCIVSGLIYAALNKCLRFQLPHFAMVILLLVCLASSYFSQYPEYSFKRVDIVYIWLFEMLFFISCIKNLKQFRLITILFFLVLFKISFFGARTWVARGFGFSGYGIAGPHGFFENSGELSLLMAMLAVMSIAFLTGQKKVSKIYYFLPLTAIMTVLAASSRGGQLSLFCGLIVVALFSGKIKVRSLLMIIAVCWISYTILPEEQKERFSSSGEDSTSQSRLLYWTKGIEMLERYPLLGVGHSAFPLYFEDHYSYLIPEDASFGSRSEVSHNTLIQISSTLGYVGLLSFLWLYWIVFSLNRQVRIMLILNKDLFANSWIYRYSKGLDAAMITFFVGSFFMSVAFYPYMYFMLMFSQSMKNAVVETIEKYKNNM